MQFKCKNTVLRVDLLMLLFPCIAILLGEGQSMLILMGSLFAHESAHWVMARALRVGMRSIRLTPFGGIAQIENPYALSPAKLFAVSCVGPVANLLLILVAAALCHWSILSPAFAVEWIRVNAVLMAFNLLPALPLDGGRMLYAALSAIFPRERALCIGLWSGRVLAGLLAAFSLCGFIAGHRLNLSPLFAAVFILVSASDERHALSDSRVQALLNGIRPIRTPTPAQVIAIDANSSPEAALRAARPDRVTLFAVYQEGHLARIVDDRAMLDALVPDANPEHSPSSST